MINKHYVIDMGLLVSGLVVIITGLLKLKWLGIRSGFLNNFHEFTGILFAVLILIHVVLHFRWIAACTRNYLFGGRK